MAANDDLKRLQLVGMEPRHVLNAGFSSFVGTVATPYTEKDLHTFTYYQPNKVPTANICTIDKGKGVRNCEDFQFAKTEIKSISGAPLNDGQVIMLFTTPTDVAYYQVVGLAKK